MIRALLNEKGTTMLEYALTACLIAVVCLVSVYEVGQQAKIIYHTVRFCGFGHGDCGPSSALCMGPNPPPFCH